MNLQLDPVPMTNVGLPRGWTLVNLADIAEINPSLDLTAISDTIDVSFLPMAAVEEETGKFSGEQVRRLGAVKRGYTRFKNGDLLLAKITPCMENGKFAVVRNLKNGIGFGSTEFHVIRAAKGIVPEFLFYFAIQKRFRNDAEHNMKGTAGQKRVPADHVARTKIFLPPTAEQERIVATIDALFADLDAAEVSLEKAQVFSIQYRKASQQTFVMGQLDCTKDQRTANTHGAVGFGFSLASSGHHEGAGWRWTKIGEIADVSGGITKNQRRENAPIEVPYLRVANVYENQFRLDDVATIRVTETERMRTLLRKGDILVVEGNGSIDQIGRVARWNGEIDNCVHQNHLIKIRTRVNWLSDYLLLWLMSPPGRGLVRSAASSTSGLYTLSISKVAEIPVLIPPETLAANILSKVAHAYAADEIARSVVSASLERISVLKQSILSAAFSGKLVPQDPNDEPASVLLERIRAARAAATSARPERKSRSARRRASA